MKVYCDRLAEVHVDSAGRIECPKCGGICAKGTQYWDCIECGRGWAEVHVSCVTEADAEAWLLDPCEIEIAEDWEPSNSDEFMIPAPNGIELFVYYEKGYTYVIAEGEPDNCDPWRYPGTVNLETVKAIWLREQDT